MKVEEGAPVSDRVVLRGVLEGDLRIFFEHQQDPEANFMAAFTVKDPADWDDFQARWSGILSDESITKKTIVFDGEVAGHILTFDQFGKPSVSYWIGREFWGRGVATSALLKLLDEVATRPLYARVASDNVASFRVLEKCGFSVVGEDRGYSEVRRGEVDEFIVRIG